ncbi:Na(+)/H(+) antiporter subunit A [compost metagenome]
MMMYWVGLFFLLAFLARGILRLPSLWWRALFVLPYLGALVEALRPFLLQEWPFPRDGLSDFFACLVTGIGACVSLYAGSYFNREDRKRFFPLLFAFTGSMLGVLWVDNIFFFYGFWEATSLCSFLLIGYKYSEESVRKGAKQALIVNTAGGLCLLFAILILVQVTGSTSLMEILHSKESLYRENGLLTSLILLAAMTKSAQFPLHFWLPNAMVAPTPASCYLHSATMVKMGVFLLARFSPLFETNVEWAVVLCVVGAITLVWGLVVSLIKTDLKQLFAWTTVSSLGGMCILVGLHVGYSWKAFFSYVLAHSCYKASLFLCVGNIDKKMGTRNVYHMTDLIRRMPMTSVALLMALGSMIGLPFSLGFLGKEYLLKSALQLRGPGSLLVIVLVCSSALSFVVAYRVLDVIFKKDQGPKRILKEAVPTMWLPPLILALLGWVTGLFLEKINTYFLKPVVSAITLEGVPQDSSLEMFTGLNIALGLSVISLGLGVLLSFGLLRHIMRVEMWMRYDRIKAVKEDFVMEISSKVTAFFQNGRLSGYLYWLVIPLLVLAGVYFDWPGLWSRFALEPVTAFQVVPLMMVLGGLFAVLDRERPLFQIMGVGIVGYGISLIYLALEATDLAMTQVAVETLSVLIFVCCLRWLKPNLLDFKRPYQWARGLCTGLTFLFTFFLCQILLEGKNSSPTAAYFAESAAPLGRGLNVVNVILVDFRALDTFGEVSALAIVALGASFALWRRRRFKALLQSSAILKTAISYFAPIFMLISFYILMRGHNSPGGGFVGGLILALAVSFYALTFGESPAQRLLWLTPRFWIAAGLMTCLIAGVLAPLLQRGPPFTALWLPGFWSWMGTPLLFDVGVYWLVLGMGTSLSFALLRRMP